MSKQEYFTTKELAAYYRFEEDTVRKWVAMGRLPAMRMGKRGAMRFRREDVEAAMERFNTSDTDKK